MGTNSKEMLDSNVKTEGLVQSNSIELNRSKSYVRGQVLLMDGTYICI